MIIFSVLGCNIGRQRIYRSCALIIELEVGADGWEAHETDIAASSKRGNFSHSILFLSVALRIGAGVYIIFTINT